MTTSTPAPPARRIAAQAAFETRTILRNGEQLLVTIVLPAIVLIGLTVTDAVSLDTDGLSRVNFVTPSVLALAVMATAFTSQAIATAFDRRNGVLRLLATTPLGRGGLIAGKVIGVLAVELVQVAVLATTALILGWNPESSGIFPALIAVLLGTAAFTALALLIAGTLRAEGVLAVANLVLILLALGGGVIVPADHLPGILSPIASALPSGALTEAMSSALIDGAFAVGPLAILAGWAIALTALTARTFRWQ